MTDVLSRETVLTILNGHDGCCADIDVSRLAHSCLALLAIVEGRAEPPTFAEIEAHANDGGHWIARMGNGGVPVVVHAWVRDGVAYGNDGHGTQPWTVVLARLHYATRWWRWDAGPFAMPEAMP